MDHQKICLIYCVNNEDLFEESMTHVGALIIPDGYTLERVVVRNASSITAGYNMAMRETDAKYKIYFHQDVNVLNQNLLPEMLFLFHRYPGLGMMGVAGSKQLPPNGIWWEAARKYGKVYRNGTILAFDEVVNDFENVIALDGLVMITQYDLPWREDLFRGWHFYDVSQSLEFIKAGYALGVPRQAQPWFDHKCNPNLIGYEANRLIFIREYGKFMEK